MKKTISFLTLLVLLISTSAFNSKNLIENLDNGTYNAKITKKSNPNGAGFSGHLGFEQNVKVKIQNNIIINISPIKNNKNSDILIGLPLSKDNKENFFVSITNFEHDLKSKSDEGFNYNYNLIILKKDAENPIRN